MVNTVVAAVVTEIEGNRYLLTLSSTAFSTFTVEATFGAISAAREWAENYAKHFGATVKVTVKWLA